MNTSLTICFVTAFFYPHLGGVERYTLQLSRQLIKEGHNVILLTTNSNESLEYELYENITIFRLPVFNIGKHRYPFLKFNKQYFQILSQIRQLPIDHFIINTRFYLTSVLGLRLSKTFNTKAIMIEHGTGHFTVNNKLLDFFGRIYEHGITHIVKYYNPLFYGVSEACNSWLKHFGICASGVLYNGIDAEYIICDQSDIRMNYEVSEDTLIVSYAGRFIEEKGILILISAIQQLLDQGNKITFFIAGSGPLLYAVTELTERYANVHCMGKMEYDQLMNLFRQSDVFINPSNYPEGLPTTILEAGAFGCAIIATPMGGTEEVIIDENYGIIIPPENVEELMSAIQYLNENRSNAHQMSIRLENRVKQYFNWPILTHHLLTILKHKTV